MTLNLLVTHSSLKELYNNDFESAFHPINPFHLVSLFTMISKLVNLSSALLTHYKVSSHFVRPLSLFLLSCFRISLPSFLCLFLYIPLSLFAPSDFLFLFSFFCYLFNSHFNLLYLLEFFFIDSYLVCRFCHFS